MMGQSKDADRYRDVCAIGDLWPGQMQYFLVADLKIAGVFIAFLRFGGCVCMCLCLFAMCRVAGMPNSHLFNFLWYFI